MCVSRRDSLDSVALTKPAIAQSFLADHIYKILIILQPVSEIIWYNKALTFTQLWSTYLSSFYVVDDSPK